jgi:hypothetical protein
MSVADDSLSLVSEGFESQDNSLSVRPSNPPEQIGTRRSTLAPTVCNPTCTYVWKGRQGLHEGQRSNLFQ